MRILQYWLTMPTTIENNCLSKSNSSQKSIDLFEQPSCITPLYSNFKYLSLLQIQRTRLFVPLLKQLIFSNIRSLQQKTQFRFLLFLHYNINWSHLSCFHILFLKFLFSGLNMKCCSLFLLATYRKLIFRHFLHTHTHSPDFTIKGKVFSIESHHMCDDVYMKWIEYIIRDTRNDNKRCYWIQ